MTPRARLYFYAAALLLGVLALASWRASADLARAAAPADDGASSAAELDEDPAPDAALDLGDLDIIRPDSRRVGLALPAELAGTLDEEPAADLDPEGNAE